MTKEEVLQKVNDYCNEKSYTTETLTEDFKEKFSDFFAKKYPDAQCDDENALADMRFNINTAFSAASKGITAKVKAFDAKENENKKRIEELSGKPKQTPVFELPDDVKTQLAELEKFKNEERKSKRFQEVLALAKKNVRHDLHKSLENYATDFVVTLDEKSEEQARKLTSRFQDIFKDSIGDIKPFAPKNEKNQKRDEELIASIPKVKVQ